MARHRLDIVADAKRGEIMGRLGLRLDSIHDPRRTGRARHRAPAHRLATPLEAARARVALGPTSTWDDHFARTFGRKTS